MEDFLCTEEDFKIAMTALAVATVLFKKVRIITFELMSNHIHLILNGEAEDCMRLFERLKARLKRILKTHERAIDWRKFQAKILPITTLDALRNEIIYVNRNAFVPFQLSMGRRMRLLLTHIKAITGQDFERIGIQ